ncbi:hypothetical protein [Natrinema halophilum]|uniref:Uncharacterized protein n=1 Tax=Natrinema halophilum TaxID=1699371 RepID=A0A7D5K6G0_9EURY|nr:hypothetical protein [Natrinema halophilum]QLG49103.1 hypothetical protein HYG82_09690 [Natrinema halophilum]
MTEDPDIVIAPRPDLYRGGLDFYREMLEGAFPPGVILDHHGFHLESHHHESGPRVWSIYSPEGAFVETLNLETFRTLSELESFLNELVAYGPADREEWVSR